MYYGKKNVAVRIMKVCVKLRTWIGMLELLSYTCEYIVRWHCVEEDSVYQNTSRNPFPFKQFFTAFSLLCKQRCLLFVLHRATSTAVVEGVKSIRRSVSSSKALQVHTSVSSWPLPFGSQRIIMKPGWYRIFETITNFRGENESIRQPI